MFYKTKTALNVFRKHFYKCDASESRNVNHSEMSLIMEMTQCEKKNIEGNISYTILNAMIKKQVETKQ